MSTSPQSTGSAVAAVLETQGRAIAHGSSSSGSSSSCSYKGAGINPSTASVGGANDKEEGEVHMLSESMRFNSASSVFLDGAFDAATRTNDGNSNNNISNNANITRDGDGGCDGGCDDGGLGELDPRFMFIDSRRNSSSSLLDSAVAFPMPLQAGSQGSTGSHTESKRNSRSNSRSNSRGNLGRSGGACHATGDMSEFLFGLAADFPLDDPLDPTRTHEASSSKDSDGAEAGLGVGGASKNGTPSQQDSGTHQHANAASMVHDMAARGGSESSFKEADLVAPAGCQLQQPPNQGSSAADTANDDDNDNNNDDDDDNDDDDENGCGDSGRDSGSGSNRMHMRMQIGSSACGDDEAGMDFESFLRGDGDIDLSMF